LRLRRSLIASEREAESIVCVRRRVGDPDVERRARTPRARQPQHESVSVASGCWSTVLLPKDAGARCRATQWLIAALNSIELFVMNVALIDLFYANEEWAKLRRPGAVEFVQRRLSTLSRSLGDKPYLDGDRFTAGDLMMTTVMRSSAGG
jgi:hypothetical protein